VHATGALDLATTAQLVRTLRYLITGGAGFIGSHVADALMAGDHEVVILDDFSTGSRANIEHLAATGAAELVEGSVTDAHLVDDLMADCDCCLHLASAVGVKLVVSHPLETLRRIVHGTDVVISAAARRGTRVLFASTSEVYGKNSAGPLHEDSDRVLGSAFKSRWSYAIAKSYGEAIAHGYHREHGADTLVVRLFNTIGPRQRGDYGMVVPRFVRPAIVGDDLAVYGDGSQSRCFLHVRDAVAAILTLSAHAGATGRAFNIGNPEPITILGLAERIIRLVGSSSRITFVPYGEAYDEGFEELGTRRPDTTALQELLGWRPTCTLDDALAEVIDFERAELAMEAGQVKSCEATSCEPAAIRSALVSRATAA
jgi:UDP-glucose 4-epimerase